MVKYVLLIDYADTKVYDRLFEVTTDNEELFEELCNTLRLCLGEMNHPYLWDLIEDEVGSENFSGDETSFIIEFFKLSGMQDCKLTDKEVDEVDAEIEYSSDYYPEDEEDLDY